MADGIVILAPLAGAVPSVGAGGAVPATLQYVPHPAPSPAADAACPTAHHEGSVGGIWGDSTISMRETRAGTFITLNVK